MQRKNEILPVTSYHINSFFPKSVSQLLRLVERERTGAPSLTQEITRDERKLSEVVRDPQCAPRLVVHHETTVDGSFNPSAGRHLPRLPHPRLPPLTQTGPGRSTPSARDACG